MTGLIRQSAWHEAVSVRPLADVAPSVRVWNEENFHADLRYDLVCRFNLSDPQDVRESDEVARCLTHRMVVAVTPELPRGFTESAVGLRYVSCGSPQRHVNVARLGNRHLRNCVVTASECGLPRVWVRRDYRGYRQAYAAALRTFGLPAGRLLVGYDIDHLAAKASVPTTPSALLEIAPVRATVNRRWGVVEWAEKRAAQEAYARALGAAAPSQVISRPKEHQKNMSFGRAAKALGIMPPNGAPGPGAWSDALASRLRSAGAIGVTDEEVAAWAQRLTRQASHVHVVAFGDL